MANGKEWEKSHGLIWGSHVVFVLFVDKMLLNLHKKSWMEGLTLQDYSEHCKLNETIVKEMLELAKNYNKVNEKPELMQS